MEQYESTVEGMKHICRLLKRPFTRNRLLSRCFTSAVAKNFHADLESFKGHIQTGRWGTVAASIPE
eukprot:8562927-Lingulodinium_polyedra.AAC.1